VRPNTLALTVLALLQYKPLHPYGIQRLIKQWGKDQVVNVSQRASLYRVIERLEEAGSGGTAELLAWVLVLAFTRGPADVLAYMPAVAWRSGTGMVVWNEMAR